MSIMPMMKSVVKAIVKSDTQQSAAVVVVTMSYMRGKMKW